MNKKYKATGFSRLLIFLIFFAPIAYLGASYYNGEDGIQNIKNMLGINKTNAQKIEEKKQKIYFHKEEISRLESEIKALEN